MKKEEFIALGLAEEQAQKAAEASANELKGFIPKARFDEVNAAKGQLEQDLRSRDGQLEELKKADPAALEAKITELQQQNQSAREEYEKQLRAERLDNALTLALTAARAKNIKLAKAALELDPEKTELDEDGRVKGLDERIGRLKAAEDSKFLFESEKAAFKGFRPGEGTGGADGDGPTTLAGAIEQALTNED